MREQELFISADRALQAVVEQIADDQWAQRMPADFQTMSEQPASLREIINYHAYDDAWVPDILAGRTMDEAGKDKYDGDLLGDNPKRSFADLVDKACAAVDGLDDPERTTHLSYGDYPAREYLSHITTFRGLRAHDIGRVTGTNPRLPDDLVAGLWEMLEPQAEEWRAMGVFGPKVDVPADAPLQDRLLGLTGRDPSPST